MIQHQSPNEIHGYEGSTVEGLKTHVNELIPLINSVDPPPTCMIEKLFFVFTTIGMAILACIVAVVNFFDTIIQLFMEC